MRPNHRLFRWFAHDHLPDALQIVAAKCKELAAAMQDAVQFWGPEFDEGIQKLLEAKDCFVRAAIASEERARGM
jgi:hypothetical protein